MAPLSYAAKSDPFLSMDCAPMPSTLALFKEKKGSNFAIWQPWKGGEKDPKIADFAVAAAAVAAQCCNRTKWIFHRHFGPGGRKDNTRAARPSSPLTSSESSKSRVGKDLGFRNGIGLVCGIASFEFCWITRIRPKRY